MKIIRYTSFLALLALVALTDSVIAQPATISWPDAVGQIAGERARAETCVALMKKYGGPAQKAHGEVTYTNAKADFDSVIAGLIVAISTGQTPANLSSLRAKLSSGVSGLNEFCGTVSKLLPKSIGRTKKNVWVDIGVHLLEPLWDGVSALLKSDDVPTRATIRTQLEAARWPAFSEVKAAL
jgi:hypothetical protein